jgi:flagellar protein FlaJ
LRTGFLDYAAKAYREQLRQDVWPFERFLAATVALGFLLEAGWLLLTLAFPDYIGDPLVVLLGFALILLLVAYFFMLPYLAYSEKGATIDKEMHLFITRMGVLAASEASRKEMFGILAGMREYGTLAKEIDKIFTLVSKWNVGLEKACRTVASQTPSELFSNFLLRLSHAVETGETAEEFFEKEQTVIMDQYEIRYDSAMRSVEIIKEVFVVLVVLVLMIMVLVTFMPFLVMESMGPWIAVTGGFMITLDLLIIYVLEAVVPGERIWHNMKMKTIVQKKITRKFQYSIVMCFIVTGIMIAIWPYLNYYLDLAIKQALFQPASVELQHPTYYIIPLLILSVGLTPLLWPGGYVMDQEADIKRRDGQYPAFIRSLGGSVGSRSKSFTLPLKKLRMHDFGPLKKNIDDLYKRLSVRIKTERAWEYFAAETQSELISKFNEMYVEGSKTGDTKKISKIISDNFIRINGMREQKYESGSNFLWMAYGVAITMSFLLFFGLYIVEQFMILFKDMSIPTEAVQQTGLFFFSFKESMASLPVLWTTSWVIIVIHCALSALMVKSITGGHRMSSAVHFVGMLWASTISAFVVMYAAQFLVV